MVKVNLFALNPIFKPLQICHWHERKDVRKPVAPMGPGSNSWPRQQQVRAKGRGRWVLHGSNHIDSHGKGMEGERIHGFPEQEVEREESELDCSVCFQVPCYPR